MILDEFEDEQRDRGTDGTAPHPPQIRKRTPHDGRRLEGMLEEAMGRIGTNGACAWFDPPEPLPLATPQLQDRI